MRCCSGSWFGASLLCRACVCVCLWSAVHSFTAQFCSVLLCVSCLLASDLSSRFGSSSPFPSPLRPPPSILCSALPCPALPYRTPISPGLPRPNSILCLLWVTLLAFLLFGLWLAGPLGSQHKAPKLTPIQTRGQDAKGACATLRVRGPS